MKDSRIKIPVLIIALLLLLFALLFGQDFLHRNKDISQQKPLENTINQNEIITERTTEDNNYSIAGYGSIKIKAGSKKAEFMLSNPEENSGLFYLQYEIILKDTEELVFRSELIEPGSEISQIELLRSFSPGKYDAILRITPVLMDNNLPAKTMTYSLILTAE